MGKQTPTALTQAFAGKEITLEHGKLAALADGSVLLRHGKTMLLATVCSDRKAREGQGFFPLSVEYREKFASAGRIPGNFFKRETKPSDYEVLVSRLIDRAIRPLFPDNYLNDTQIFVTLVSGDADVLPDSFAAFAASAALTVSDIPFLGPISEVRVARVEGAFVINPTRTELAKADMDFIIAGSNDSIVMVEGEAHECSESDLVEAIRQAHEVIKQQIQMQLDLRAAVGVTSVREVPAPATNDELKAEIGNFASEKVAAIARKGSSKQERKEGFDAVYEELVAALTAAHDEEFMSANGGFIAEAYENLKRDIVREVILAEQTRLDGRRPNEIRPIWCEIDYLPSTHGSSIFTRGETQSLTSVTLGSKLDEAMIDNALDMYYDKFMLHYNFPPFSTGEVKPVRGTSRREVGHGNLARRSLEQVMPVDYPYTVRVVSDILESNGSSSMATVCAGTLALMDAGVPIQAPVAGIAMGLITDNKGRSVVLSDILGDEDHLGDMDFKVTGTTNGICGCQMDIKIEGLDYELLVRALEQARQGRLHILNIMTQTIAQPNPDLKPHAPRILVYEIPSETIGAVIGSGGKVIQGIQARTKTTINIEEKDGKGIVTISGVGFDTVNEALKVVKGIVLDPEIGEEFEATVVTLMPFGAFVEFLPGKEGLVHISELAWQRVEKVEDVVKKGDVIRVKYMGKDEKNGKAKLSHKVLLPRPDNLPQRPPKRDNNNAPRQ